MANSDSASFVLLFNNVQGTSDVAALSENHRYLLCPPNHNDTDFWKNNQSPTASGSVFGLCFGQHMYSPDGWTLGRSDDSEVCDFQIAHSKKTAVSKKHILFDVEPVAHRPRIKVLSQNSIRVHIGEDRLKRKRIVTLFQGETLDIIDSVTIDLGEVTFRAWRPVLTGEAQSRYRRNAERFNEEFLDSIRRLPVNLDSKGTSTFTMRFGANNACYKVDDPVQARRGSFASVYRVKELRTGKIFAAKEPHFRMNQSASKSRHRWENLTGEFTRLSKLHHVRTLI